MKLMSCLGFYFLDLQINYSCYLLLHLMQSVGALPRVLSPFCLTVCVIFNFIFYKYNSPSQSKPHKTV